jgi:acyl-CoA thioester hydrolase
MQNEKLKEKFPLQSLESYRHWTKVTIRFSDQDPLGHVNNVAYAAYVEASRTMFVGNLIDTNVDKDIDFILVSVKIDYLKEIKYPGTVEVGARVIRLGNKSFTTGFGVFLEGRCVATSESVNVFFSLKTRRTVAIPAHIRSLLENDPMLAEKVANYSRGY